MTILLILFSLLLMALAISAYCFHICFYSPKNRQEDPYALLNGEQYAALSDGIFYCTRKMEEAHCEFLQIRSFDGTSLSARYYHHADNAPVMILFHGYRSMALRDSAGGYILSKKAGFNVLAVDQRAHGRSGGCVISFGIQERKDCLCWVQYMSTRFGAETPLILSGLSMGAATVLMAANLPLPKNVVGIMADCPYSSPSEIILKVASDRKYPPKLVYPFIRIGARLFGKFNIEEANALTSVANSKIPILLIHGEDDRFVPCEMSQQIAKCSGENVEFHTFPNAGHGLSYTSDPLRYEWICYHFLASIPRLTEYFKNNDYVYEVLQRTL